MAHALPAFLSFFFPGFGQVVKGEIVKGFVIFTSFVVSAISMVGLPVAIVLWIWSVVDAYGGGLVGSATGGESLTPKQAVAASRGLAKQHYENGLEFTRAGNKSMAETHYRLALTHDPTLANAHLNLSQLLIEIGRTEDAEMHARKAAALYEGKPDQNLNLSNAYNNLGAVELVRYNLSLARGDTAASEIHRANMRRFFEQAIAACSSNEVATENLRKFAS